MKIGGGDPFNLASCDHPPYIGNSLVTATRKSSSQLLAVQVSIFKCTRRRNGSTDVWKVSDFWMLLSSKES